MGWSGRAPAPLLQSWQGAPKTKEQGLRFLRAELPTILAKRSDVLSPRMLRIIEDLCGDWHRLDERIEGVSSEIATLAEQDAACKRLMSVPGIGPIISSAMVAAIGTGDVFSKGRDFGAWLGLVPKQISTGDRTILGKISKRGNRDLRALFVQAAWVVLVKIGPKHWQRYGLETWIAAAKKRLHHNVLARAMSPFSGCGHWTPRAIRWSSCSTLLSNELPVTIDSCHRFTVHCFCVVACPA
jgi:transposase